jgi:HAD superfamily hydrolase (TIGR01549 family)
MNRAIAAILFDMDGVLIESVDSKTEAFRRVFEQYPDKVGEIVRYHCMNMGVSRYVKIPWIFEHILHEPLPDQLKESLLRNFAEYVREAMEKTPLVAGCREFLVQYSAKVPCGVVSAAPEGEVRDILARKGIAGHFSLILGSPSGKYENIMKFLAHHSIDPGSAVMIGDSLTDYRAAQEAGCLFIGRVAPGEENPFAGKPGITALISDLDDLSRVISGAV